MLDYNKTYFCVLLNVFVVFSFIIYENISGYDTNMKHNNIYYIGLLLCYI